ncbi:MULTISPECIES: tRNA 2-selenouridine(34) synthase MnmH [Bacillaceae]|uniref:tRNA 2-selenouridine synthase n=2 Tax=Bacillus infantis TaxID=324767 RepID=U5LCJ1_9BACI|nr:MULTISPECIES: tRNA 2-selenouridine(34) synthase MnmH [Bacillus]AGX04287.1 tRNA 2-selenouridine synthase [Bacillus infantis NRRL B-14911]EAR67013.1 probable ATP /GTP binding protein [Bacillus sp. NRRL B-14911]MDW2878382.1 tRNA 2-selenouridine(34) synthase MnmH [Bacillus infantis]PLR74457.1 tRNA 2-selenouridine(34) synthase MnmH [Bacillus sp. UMB0728]RYI30212.1 tRNA 2-selenouridine(34) synthase MnmH [Bacillus infantis]
MFQDVGIEKLLELKDKRKLVLVDVRSPSEYKDSTIPGSINIPLFNDEERAEIGTIYKQVSVEAAKERGLEIVSAKLPDFIREFNAVEGDKAVFCWRGGMRSRTSATLLDLMGIRTYRLEGGVRAHRRWVVETLEGLKLKPKAFVLNGYTGSGKTAILEKLAEKDYSVIDLEGLARHRGSIFGHIGLEPSNQKMFDSRLLRKVLEVQDSPFVFFEAESKRVGKVVLPESIIEKKEQGIQLFIEMPMEERVRHILEDYKPWDHPEACFNAFSHIKNRIHTPIAAEIEQNLIDEEYGSAVALLLKYYYDPRYTHTAKMYPEDRIVTIQAANIEDAAQKIEEYVLSQSPVAQ